MEKDETELQLEKLVFGDNEGFREGLKSFRQDSRIEDFPQGELGGADRSSDQEEFDLAAVNDADVSMSSWWLTIRSFSYIILAFLH